MSLDDYYIQGLVIEKKYIYFARHVRLLVSHKPQQLINFLTMRCSFVNCLRAASWIFIFKSPRLDFHFTFLNLYNELGAGSIIILGY